MPLSRNRAYHILWSSQMLSELVIEIAAVAFPLLILLHSGSPLQLGVASAAMATAGLLAVMPAGALADRWNRCRLLLWAQVARALGMAALLSALLAGIYSFPLVICVMVLEGIFAAVFDPVEHATLPQVVPDEQLATAVARNAARPFIAGLLGPAVAGLLFAVHPTYPFLAYAAMLTASAVAIIFLRVPRGQPSAGGPGTDDGSGPSEPRAGGFLHEVAAGLRWAATRPVIRTTLVWVVASNLLFNALIVVIIARSHQDGVGAGEIGLTMSCLGVGGVLGGLFAARVSGVLPGWASILGFSWTIAAATAVMAVIPAGLPLGILLGVSAVLAPVANTTVLTHQILVTPDRLRGRLSGVVGLGTGLAAALGPLAGGLLADRQASSNDGSSSALLLVAAAMAVVAVGATLSPVLRRFHTP